MKHGKAPTAYRPKAAEGVSCPKFLYWIKAARWRGPRGAAAPGRRWLHVSATARDGPRPLAPQKPEKRAAIPVKNLACRPTKSTASRSGAHAKSAPFTADCRSTSCGRGGRPPRLYPPVRLGARVGQVQGATRSNSGQGQSLPELPGQRTAP